MANVFSRVISFLFQKMEPIKQNQIEADCPRCHLMEVHDIKGDIYRCTVCGNEQPADTALTLENTTW